MARKGIGDYLPALLVILVGIMVIVAIWRNKNFLRFGSPVTAVAAIGATVPGPNVYPVVAQITPPGEGGLSEATGGDGDPSYRDNVTFPCNKCARETTWFVVPGEPREGEGDMDLPVLKHQRTRCGD